MSTLIYDDAASNQPVPDDVTRGVPQAQTAIQEQADIAIKGRTAGVLEAYARSIDAQQITCVDSDLPHVMRRAAELLRQYCPETMEYERQMEALKKMAAQR